MKKIRFFCSMTTMLLVCCLLGKPASAESVATARRGYRVYAGSDTSCIGYFDTKTGKVKTVVNRNFSGWYDCIDNLCYYKGNFYIDGANGDFYRVSKKGKISKSYGSGENIAVYKNKIYYLKNNSIRRCSLKGKKKTVLVRGKKDHRIVYFTVIKGKLYYIAEEKYDVSINSARLTGKNRRRICSISDEDDGIWTWPADNTYYRAGNTIYFYNDSDDKELRGIYKYTAGHAGIRQVCSVGSISVDDRIAGIRNKQIYFTRATSGYSYYFCRVPISGGNYKTIKKMHTNIPIIGKGNYCMYYKNGKYYSMKLNGKSVKRVRPGFLSRD